MKMHGKAKIFLTILLAVTITFLNQTPVIKAASASVKMYLENKDTVKKGDTVSVSVKVNASEQIGDFEALIYYDEEILEYQSGGSFVSGGDGVLRITDTGEEKGKTAKKYVLTFQALKNGVCDLTWGNSVSVFSFQSGTKMSVSSGAVSVSVGTKASGDAGLKSLKISPGKLFPAFNANTVDYTAEVDSGVNNIVVSAQPANSENTSVFVEGSSGLKTGKNTVLIKVKAEDGNLKEYRIIVTKLKKAEKKEKKQKEINVYEKDGTIYMKNSFTYQVVKVEDESVVPKGYEKTKLLFNGVKVTAYTRTDDWEETFVLIYAKTEKGKPGFYTYDREEETMQRYVEGIKAPSVSQTEEPKETPPVEVQKTEKDGSGLFAAIGILGLLVVFLSGGLIYALIKIKKMTKEDTE